MTTADLAANDTPQTDLTNCDRETIHLLGHVQAYGCLVATSGDLTINHLSANCHDLLGLDPAKVVGVLLGDLLPSKTVHDLRAKLHLSNATGGASRLFDCDVLGNGKKFDVSIHGSGQNFVFELEPKVSTEDRDDLALVQPLMARIRGKSTATAAAQEAAMALQVLCEFDRVMVYRFLPDGAGEVIAERCATTMEPFLGLRYPASDIPKLARELYKRSPLRLIADVNGVISPLVPERNPNGAPLDLSLAVTRAVSPIHLEYLRNMGVAASMSVSIVIDGELWGLLACHHNTPRYIDFERRTAIEVFAQFFSYELSHKLTEETRADEQTSREMHDRLMLRLSAGENLIDSLDVIAEELAQIVPNDGIAVFSDGRFKSKGAAPTRGEAEDLVRFLNTVPAGQVFATDQLRATYPACENFADPIAGMLAVPISRVPRNYIVFFRREVAQSVTWAGNPDKPVEVGPNGTRLTPRKSFEAWTQMVRGTSAPWLNSEINAANALRISLIEIVFKLTDQANNERQITAEKQELLIAELDHRVRNILNLIQGLISQSRNGNTDIQTYTNVLDGRVQALARAHDQLTSHEWAPTSVKDLIGVEARAFLDGEENRLIVEGDPAMLAPEAFSTMALVVHELVTNSAKYGALADRSGQVTVTLEITDDGALHIAWRETGGPPVKAPDHRGFGSTIIERIVPFELKGKAEVHFKLGGFEADFTIPANFVTAGDIELFIHDGTATDKDTIEDIQLTGSALVLEDSMLIALDAADTLTSQWARDVKIASSVSVALEMLGAEDFDFAVLDVNLGNETSLPVAQALESAGIPFILATGYGDVESILAQYPAAPVILKPFTSESLINQLRTAIANRR